MRASHLPCAPQSNSFKTQPQLPCREISKPPGVQHAAVSRGTISGLSRSSPREGSKWHEPEYDPPPPAAAASRTIYFPTTSSPPCSRLPVHWLPWMR
ncbi:hypothetical protein NHX12_030467 [Muraenolepis orangiensis]|uniref:Uncharacterized protein n=1 Tax=Muraenolepis orangiensis TaxID=630683 RepID=A0A9Q0EBT6_9TELE|nr:hypothetical protein NHX12_030467 [Muraenolepis orangiensis]